jgi:FkbM family methyltransferase
MCGEGIGVYLEDNYEPDVCRIIEEIVQPGWVCVDVGAHKGYYTLLLAKTVGEQGYVIAFEAHPDNAAVVLRNAMINDYGKRVRVENIAISDGSSSRVRLFPGRQRSSAEWNIVGHDVSGNQTEPELEVPATSLDAYFSAAQPVDFIKIDIEGAEALALSGMRRVLRESQPVVLIEFHDAAGWLGRRELFEAGYGLRDVVTGRWLDPDRATERVYHCLAVPSQARA